MLTGPPPKFHETRDILTAMLDVVILLSSPLLRRGSNVVNPMYLDAICGFSVSGPTCFLPLCASLGGTRMASGKPHCRSQVHIVRGMECT